MVAPGSLQKWQIFIKKLEKDVPEIITQAKVALNSLLKLTPDSLEMGNELLSEYTPKEIQILSKYGRLTIQ